MTLRSHRPGHLHALTRNGCAGENKGGRIVTFVTFRGIVQNKITRIYNMVGTMHGGKI